MNMKKKPINIQEYNTKELHGTVVSCGKMQKTIVVRVDRKVAHPLYKKIITKFSKFHVHDEDQISAIGDLVQIKESRPISKTKSWVLLNIIKKAVVENIG